MSYFFCGKNHRNGLVIQPWPTKASTNLRNAKTILDRIGDKIVAERKSAIFQEQSYQVREKVEASGKDLLTLLVQSNLQDSDGMNDLEVRARECFLYSGLVVP